MDLQVNWKAFIGGKAVVDVNGGAALGGSTYWGEIEDIGQDGQIVHVHYKGRAAVMDRSDSKWRLSDQLHHTISITQAPIHDLEGNGVSVDASRHFNSMLFVFPKDYKPKDGGETYQWSQVHGTDEWLDAHASGEAHSSAV